MGRKMERKSGKIHSYSKDKNNGIIMGEDEVKYFFWLNDVYDKKQPKIGERVMFNGFENKKREGYSAKEIELIDRPAEAIKIAKKEPALCGEPQITFENAYEKQEEKEPEKKNSRVKSAGLKSALYLKKDEVLITSFGRGNAAILEKTIKNNVVEDKEHNFSILPIEKKYKITGKDHAEALADNPQNAFGNMPGQTTIFTKVAFEKQFFGQTYEDNIHIQIIHNILDIKKILAVHTNNITYALNNVFRDEDDDTDFIGSGAFKLDISSYDDYKMSRLPKEQFEKFLKNDRLSYFGEAFYTKNKKSSKLREEKEIYYILALLSEARHVCVHSPEFGIKERGKIHFSNIYNLDTKLNNEAKEVLNKLYREKVSNFSAATFVKRNKERNFYILFTSMGISKLDEQIELVKDFYNFSIKKSYKNCGFSIKKIREYFIDLYANKWRDDSQDIVSVRGKAYNLFDFIISEYYEKNESEAERLTNKLRTKNKNEQKEKTYYEEAKRLGNILGKSIAVMTEMVLDINNKSYNCIDRAFCSQAEKNIKKEVLSDASNVSCFSKLIYLITLFLDGKEINDLISTVANKMDNIASLMAVLKTQNREVLFRDEFALFNSKTFLKLRKAKKYDKRRIDGTSPEDYECTIVNELREINSFARMSEDKTPKRSAFEEAAYLLNENLTKKDIDALMIYLDALSVKNQIKDLEKKNKTNSNKYNELKNKLKEFDLSNIPCDNLESDMRNFIINNVISSRRFNYLVRYTNPRKMRKCINNPALLKFTFRDIPDSQIERYYKICTEGKGNQKATREEKVEFLSKIIQSFGYEEVRKIKQIKDDKNTLKQKQRMAISLYLNVLYQIAKNLVNVNSRYVIAFHCLERDANVCNCAALNDDDMNYCELTEKMRILKTKYAKATFDKKMKRLQEIVQEFGNPNELDDTKKIEHPAYRYYSRISKKYNNDIRVCNYLKQNISNTDDVMERKFRNNVAHLNSIRNMNKWIENAPEITSYFQLYHYLMQKKLAEEYRMNEEKGFIIRNDKGEIINIFKDGNDVIISEQTPKYVGWVESNNKYCKDFVKALCAPFGYNLPRFKNLSIDEKFDRNDKRNLV